LTKNFLFNTSFVGGKFQVNKYDIEELKMYGRRNLTLLGSIGVKN
jgi:hypothetical protein